MSQINPRSLGAAIEVSDAAYELILTNWGNRGQKQDAQNGSIQYPPVHTLLNGSIPIEEATFNITPPSSVSAIAIAPRSSLDRCILHVVPQGQAAPAQSQMPPTSGIQQGFVNQGGVLETEQVLSIKAPLIGQLPGPIIIRAHPAHYFGDTYIASGAASNALSPFGTAISANSGGPVWNNPELRLLLFLTGSTALPPPQRAPVYVPVIGYVFGGSAEELISVVPIMGRRYVRVGYRADSGGASVRLSGTFHTTTPAAGPIWATNQDFEVPLIAATAVAANSAVQLSVDNPGVSYLLVKATATANQVARLVIEAFD